MVGHRMKVAVACTLIMLTVLVSCTKEEIATPVPDAVTASTDYTQLVSSAVEISLGTLRPTVETSGIVQSQYEVVVRSRSAGTIQSVGFELGDLVEEGRPLVTLDDTIAQLSLTQVETQAENIRKEVASNEQLYARGAISLNQLNLSKATLAGLEAQLARAAESLRDVSVSSPITGRVAEKNASLIIGDTLPANQVVAKIVDLERLRVPVALGQSQIFLVKEGASAVITIATPGDPLVVNGTVRAISAGSDPRTGSWTVLVDFDNPDPSIIRAGLSAKVSITNDEAPVHPLVPNASIVYRGGNTYVYLLEQSSARLLEIDILERYGDYSAVKPKDSNEDLAGKRVLTTGLAKLTDGSAVVTQNPLSVSE